MACYPELVLLDIDGTLLATDSFWIGVLGSALERVCARRGLDAPSIPRERILDALGRPDAEGYPLFLPEALHGLIPELRAEVERLEAQSFAKGMAPLYPGVEAALRLLAGHGAALALVSNCGLSYLRLVAGLPALAGLLAGAWCAESPGVASKADMVAAALAAHRPRRAALVGDRTLDQQAAHAHGVPFFLFTGGFSPPGEAPAAEGRFGSWAELPGLLAAWARRPPGPGVGRA